MAKLTGNAVANPWLALSSKSPVAYVDQLWDEAFANSAGDRPYKTQAEINQDFLTRLNSLQGAGLSISVVDALPDTGSALQNVLYLVKVDAGADQNYYDEYVYLPQSEDRTVPAHFEQIGSTKVDLTDYVTQTEFSELETKVDNLETAAEGSVLGVKLVDEEGVQTTVATDGTDHYIHLNVANAAEGEGVDDADLATIAAVKAAVAAVDVSGQLADYVKEADLDTKVDALDYAKTSEVSSAITDALAAYTPTSGLDAAIDGLGYVKDADIAGFVSSASLAEQDNPSVSAGVLSIPVAKSVRTSGAVDTRMATEKAVADAIVAALTGYGVKTITVGSDSVLGVSIQDGTATLSSTISAELTEANHLVIKGKADAQIADIDMAKFVVDGMLDNVALETKEETGAWGAAGTYIHFTFNASAGSKELWLNVSSLLDAITYSLVASTADSNTLVSAQTTSDGSARTMTLTLGVMTTAAQYNASLEEGQDRLVTLRGLKDVISTIVMAGEGIVAGAHLDDGGEGVDLSVTDQIIQIPIATSISAQPSGSKLATEGAVRNAISAIPVASDTAAGLMSTEMYTKLLGINEGATADSALPEEEILAAIAAAEA